jgi:putative MATE family efflux protein
MKKSSKMNLTEGNIARQLMDLALPTIFSMLGMVIFNLVDTFYVGRLGAEQLAAMSFTSPVVLIVNCLSVGVALGTSVLVSKAVGKGKNDEVVRLSTDSLVLGLSINIILVVIGLFTIDPLFTFLGAEERILGYVKEYMTIWYLGMVMVVIPQIGNNIIRALGDTKSSGIIITFSAITNIILDPLLIFGIGPFPALGIRGAAIATVISRTLTLIATLYILIARENLISVKTLTIKKLVTSWKSILYIGIPNSLTQMASPIGMGIVTKLLADYGSKVVAGYGVACKLESLALAIIGSLSIIIGPFTGQNIGAKKFKRVIQGQKLSELFSLVAGLALALLLGFFARPIARVFNKDAQVIDTIVIYLRVVPIAYMLQGILKIGTTILNVLNKPFLSSALILIQTFVLYIPLALVGSKFFGVIGIFCALSLSYFASGSLTHFVSKRQTQKYKEKSLKETVA